MRFWGVLRSGKKAKPDPPATILSPGYWTKGRLRPMPSLDHASAYGAVKVANDPCWRVSISAANVVTVEVRVSDPVTGMPAWVVAVQYPG